MKSLRFIFKSVEQTMVVMINMKGSIYRGASPFFVLLLLHVVLQSLAKDDCSQRPFSLATFNAALTPMINSYEERKIRLPQALEDLDADVICLQEVTYIVDLNAKINEYLHLMNPPELEIKETTSVSYLYLYIDIQNDGNLCTKLYDKRDGFSFPIVNFPFMSSNIPIPAYGVYISQLLRYEEDMRVIMKQLKKTYPYSWSFLHSTIFTDYEMYKAPDRDQKSYPCDASSYPNFSKCIHEHCDGLTGYFLPLCTINSCQNQLFDLPTDCLSCMAGSVESIDTATAKCASVGVGEFEGRNRYQPEGVLVLSKLPIETAARVQFIPGVVQVFPRGILEVNIFNIGKVACTHLTADLASLGLPYIEVKINESLGLSSYVEQQFDELVKIQNLYGAEPMILMGDLNTGPPVPEMNTEGKLVEHYVYLLTDGFDSPFVDLIGQCTYCADNQVAWPVNNILDHVLLRGYKTLSVSRIFDNATNPLSDHYGIYVTLCKK